MSMVECKALQGIDSTIPAVGHRAKGDVFPLPRHLADHLRDIDPPLIKIIGEEQPRPKLEGASHAGPKTQRASSSLVGQASPRKTSSTLQPATTKAKSKR